MARAPKQTFIGPNKAVRLPQFTPQPTLTVVSQGSVSKPKAIKYTGGKPLTPRTRVVSAPGRGTI